MRPSVESSCFTLHCTPLDPAEKALKETHAKRYRPYQYKKEQDDVYGGNLWRDDGLPWYEGRVDAA